MFTIVNKPLSSNCYIIVKKEKCVVVDPGTKDNAELLNLLSSMNLVPEYIILTHEHYDHIGGCNILRCQYPEVKLIASKLCNDNIQDERWNLSRYIDEAGIGFTVSAADLVISEDCVVSLCNCEFFFILTPGHSMGSMCFSVNKCFFTGDTFIPGVKPVLKLKGSNEAQYELSINKIAHILNDKEFVLFPGHGGPIIYGA